VLQLARFKEKSMKRIGALWLVSSVLFLAAVSACSRQVLQDPDFPSIQAALDALPPSGGRVFIPAGIYILKGSLKLRDNVTISGAGPATVLKACDLVLGKTAAPIQVGEAQVRVENTTGFEVGMDVFIHKEIEWGPNVEKAFSYTITAIENNILKFDKAAAYAQPTGATVCTGTPVVLVFKKRNIVIENLTIDGNRKPNWVYVPLKMAGVYFWGSTDCTVQNCQIINASGDGISAQFPTTGYPGDAALGTNGWATVEKHEGNGSMILNNRIHGAAGFGIHLGGGQTKSIVKGNIVRDCAWDGFYWCWDNALTIVTDNIFTNNGWNGIGGVGSGGVVISDVQNITSNNICSYNGNCGIHINGGEGNIISGNVCYGNSRAEKGRYPGILIDIPGTPANKVWDIAAIVTGNSCNDVGGESAMQKCGVELAPNVSGVIIRDNISKGNLGKDILPDTNLDRYPTQGPPLMEFLDSSFIRPHVKPSP